MPRLDLDTLGHRIRHFRTAHDRTLDQLGAAVGLAASQLSLIENGKREPKLSTLENIATALDIELSDLLAQEAPSKRAELEVALARAQAGPLFRSLGIPAIKPPRGLRNQTLESVLRLHEELQRRAEGGSRRGGGVSNETLESVLRLHEELQRRAKEAIATPEEARRANTDLRERM